MRGADVVVGFVHVVYGFAVVRGRGGLVLLSAFPASAEEEES